MNKQTKQLALLGGLVIAAGIVAYFTMFNDPAPTPPPADNSAAPAPAAGAPGPAPAAQPTPGQPAPAPGTAPGAAPVVSNEPLPMPKEEQFSTVTYTWKYPVLNPGPSVGGFAWDWPKRGVGNPFDPLHVANLDVVAPDRKLYIERVRSEWVIEGVTITPQQVLKTNDKGEPELDSEGNKQYQKMDVKEAWFRGKRRPYKAGERLTGTRFTVDEIIQNKEKTSVKLRGDSGEELELELAIPGRYPD